MAWFDDLWQGITDTVGEAQCGLGFHDGTWNYTHNDKCEQKRVCTRNRCSNVSYRTSHYGWSAWKYFKESSCLQERFCTRCNHREERTHHFDWTEWNYISKGVCLQTRSCTRCQESESRRRHQYGDEKYYTYPHSCKVHELCKRCGDKKDTYLEAHTWNVIRHPTIPNKYQRYCSRCNKHEDIQTS